MRKVFILIGAIALLSGCTIKQSPPTKHQEALITQLANAPPRTILVSYNGFEVVCDTHHGNVEIARIGSWNCGSGAIGTPQKVVLDYGVIHVVKPTDSDYPELIQNLKPLLDDLREKGRPLGI